MQDSTTLREKLALFCFGSFITKSPFKNYKNLHYNITNSRLNQHKNFIFTNYVLPFVTI